ncbi:MAG: hypothetical protein US50_C0015G0004 [Candidatus Nomurabacteria bacterium GW2011_GWB1_37_5]|uniref:CHRD domain-containing protein n=1 Tax=Candidatus Nomurabacteria bacterium GW2011_GWB1_37_5 TaxID=1618742 RepID=A0A0G0GZF6_9BACT|nr:MAG: hypothetical protein US50_C0015G0004 [Candidatus Nomurabacteria bacterium GW2011_GWB1_37_5]
MIKKFVIGVMVLSLMMVVGISRANAQSDNASDKAQNAACMQAATEKQNTSFKSAQDAFLAVIKSAKENGESTWWPWSRAKVEARKVRKEVKLQAKETFKADKEACKNNFTEQGNRGDKGEQGEQGEQGERGDGKISFILSAQNDSSVSGIATFEEEDGNVDVKLQLTGFPENISEPAHIHLGACPNPDAVKYPLTSVVNGKSETTLTGMTFAQLKTELPLAVNVHKSQDEAGVYVACGDVKF